MGDFEDEPKKTKRLWEQPHDFDKELRLSRSIIAAMDEHSLLARELESTHSLARIFADQEALAKQFGLSAAFKDMLNWKDTSALTSVLETLRGQDLIPRSAIGPLADLKHLGLFDARTDYLHGLGINLSVLADFEARFRLPDAMEAARLAGLFDTSLAAKALESFTGGLSVRAAMESMKTPWFDTANPVISASAFAAIQNMGTAIGNMPTFDTDLSSALRLELGDWREPIDWPASIFTDLEARSHFYASLGVNVALTDLPARAFRESLAIADLWDAPPPLVGDYDAPEADDKADEDEQGFARTNEAHDRLQRLETQLRRFIDQIMIEECGPEWPKHRMPPQVFETWLDKKRRAQRHTEADLPLIAYADFTDYELVICKRDNWRLFEKYFDRPESVRESMQRLYPIRVDTMHSRPITQDDELFLMVECKRLLLAMGRKRA
jgi:hypothetical protein